MKIGICDDDIIYLRYMESVVKGYFSEDPEVEIDALMPESFSSPDVIRKMAFDLLIIDIDLGKYNGIEVVRELQQNNQNCSIIFVSSYMTFVMDVYEVNHMYYVVKSKLEQILPKALEKAYSIYKKSQKNKITFSYKNVKYQIKLSEILYIEAYGRYLFFHGRKQKYQCICSMKGISRELTEDFSQCHKSFIINFNYIQSVTRTECVLTNGMQIPVSNTYSKRFQANYVRFVSEHVSI